MSSNRVMLSTVRVARGLTQGDLAKGAKVSQGLISKAEAGLLQLENDTLEAISIELDVPLSLISGPISAAQEPNVVFHRSRASLAVSKASELRAGLDLAQLQLSGLLADEARPITLTRTPLPDDGLVSPEEVAVELRKQLGLEDGPIRDLSGVLENAGVVVSRRSLGTSLVDAVMAWPEDGFPLVHLNDHTSADRQRFTIAHELAHVIMHTVPTEGQEREADRFASEFLMPQSSIQPILADVTVPKLAALKAQWGVSMAALVRRARDLGEISESRYRSINIEFSAMGYKTREPVQVEDEHPHLIQNIISTRLEHGASIEDLSASAYMTVNDFDTTYLGARHE